MTRPGQLDERAFAQHLRDLERIGNDRVVVQRVGRHGAVDLAGNVIPRHVYRLECGHLVQIHGVQLPTSTRELHCPDCRRARPVVEHITGR